jgi:hypothetical protein
MEHGSSPIEHELASGERLLWSGQPARGFILRPGDLFAILFSLLWCGFAVVWECSVIFSMGRTAKAEAVPFLVFGAMFVLIGLYLVFGRFFVDARNRSRTFYGITNERVIIVTGFFARQVKSLNLRTLDDISLTEHKNGRGVISFGPMHPFAQRLPAGLGPWNSYFSSPGFEMIDGAREVYELLRQTQRTTN